MEWRGSAGPVFYWEYSKLVLRLCLPSDFSSEQPKEALEQPWSPRLGPLLPVPRSVSVLDDHPVGWVGSVKLV